MEPWMIVLIVLAAIAIITAVVIMIFKKKNNNKLIADVRDIGNYEDGILTINGIQFLVQFIKVGQNEEVTINSSLIIQIKSRGKSRLLTLNQTKLPRLVIIYPYHGRIKRYINENEMEFITYQNYFWNMHVCKLSDLRAFKDYIEERT